MRSLVLEGWDWDELAGAFAAVIGFGVVTVSAALWSLRGRAA